MARPQAICGGILEVIVAGENIDLDFLVGSWLPVPNGAIPPAVASVQKFVPISGA
jgi:hypothetical protein